MKMLNSGLVQDVEFEDVRPSTPKRKKVSKKKSGGVVATEGVKTLKLGFWIIRILMILILLFFGSAMVCGVIAGIMEVM